MLLKKKKRATRKPWFDVDIRTLPASGQRESFGTMMTDDRVFSPHPLGAFAWGGDR